MESSKIGYWLQVGANIGILASLILVGLQLNQNTELTRLSVYADEEDGYLMMGGVVAGETLAAAWSKAIADPESLTVSEIVQLDGFLDNVITQLNRRHYLHSAGLYETSASETSRWLVPKYFSNRFARAWWREKSKNFSDDGIKPIVDKALAKIDVNGHAEIVANIQAAIQEP